MKHISSRSIFFIIIMAVISIALFFSSISLYNNIEKIVIEEKGRSAMNISIAVSKLIEQDIESLKQLVHSVQTSSEYDEEYYAKMQALFQEIKQKTGVKFLYSAKKISDDEIMYIFDGELPDSDLFSPLGSLDKYGDIEREAYTSLTPSFTKIYADEVWGELLTGVDPIIDPVTKEVIAYVGVDVSAGKIKATLNDIRNFILLNFFFIVIVIGIVLHRFISITTFFSEIDYLTGLYNKSYHERYLKKLIKKSSSNSEVFSLIMIDLDNFKEINDIFGHRFGDKVLKEVADTLRKYTRKTDICSRYGGDEFVVILQDAKEQYAVFVCERFLEELTSLELEADNGEIVSISVSIGISQWKKNMTADQLTINSDKAMYISKNTGKNKMTIYKVD